MWSRNPFLTDLIMDIAWNLMQLTFAQKPKIFQQPQSFFSEGHKTIAQTWNYRCMKSQISFCWDFQINFWNLINFNRTKLPWRVKIISDLFIFIDFCWKSSSGTTYKFIYLSYNLTISRSSSGQLKSKWDFSIHNLLKH